MSVAIRRHVCESSLEPADALLQGIHGHRPVGPFTHSLVPTVVRGSAGVFLWGPHYVASCSSTGPVCDGGFGRVEVRVPNILCTSLVFFVLGPVVQASASPYPCRCRPGCRP